MRNEEDNMLKNLRRAVSLMMCTMLVAPGCATTRATRAQMPGRSTAAADPSMLAEYVQKLAPGSPVRVERTVGGSLRGILIKATDRSVVVQPRTRIPEPPVEVALTDVLSVTPESPRGSNFAKAIAAGAAAGAGAALGIFLILVAAYSD
jgi:hypothetical protein